MRALSLIQPYATLIALGAKQAETRGWQTQYRGELAIHASKVMPVYEQGLFWREPFHTVLKDAHYATPSELRLGCIVAVARLVDVVRATLHAQVIGKHEKAFGDYSPGRWAWLLEDVRPLTIPIYCRGWQSVWEVPEDIERQVRMQVVR